MNERWLKRLAALLALCLLLSMVPAVTAEEEIVSAPVDESVGEIESADLWTEDIAMAVEAAEAETVATPVEEAADAALAAAIQPKIAMTIDEVYDDGSYTGHDDNFNYYVFVGNEDLPAYIQAGSYHGNGGDVVIPDGVDQLCSMTFSPFFDFHDEDYKARVNSITSVTIPSSVTKIWGNDAGVSRGDSGLFKGNTGITRVIFENNAAEIGNNMFAGCTALESVQLPGTVEKIGQYAFANCSSLKSISMPAGVSEIGVFAFMGSGLKSVAVSPKVTVIDNYTFADCAYLTTVIIPDSVEKIAMLAFENCTSLVSINGNFEVVLNHVKQIVGAPFTGCSSIKSVTIGSDITSLSLYDFINCTNLRKFTVNGHGWSSSYVRVGSSSYSPLNIHPDAVISMYCDNVRPGLSVSGNLCTCERCLLDQGYTVEMMHIDEIADPAVPATCTEDGLTAGSHCGYCGDAIIEQLVVPAPGHREVVDPAVPATLTFTGLTEGSHCRVCGEVLVAQEVVPKLIDIRDASVANITDKTYTGGAIKPTPTVRYEGAKLKKGTDYTLSWKNNTAVGKATVTIKGAGRFGGSKKVTFAINPKKVALSKLTAGKGKLTVQWKKSAGAGYQIQYGLNSSFKNAKTVTVTKAATVKKVLKNLKSGKKYYVRIRGYKKIGSVEYASKWSKAMSAKVK